MVQKITFVTRGPFICDTYLQATSDFGKQDKITSRHKGTLNKDNKTIIFVARESSTES